VRFIQAILLLVFLGAIGLFAAQNTQPLTVRFLDRGITSSVALLAVVIYFLGMLSGWTVVGFVSRSIRRMTDRRTE
jgi:lipopolysaccharide assembly protein A